MRVLIACEFSGRVREAFRQSHGIDALSCDLLPCEYDKVDTDYHLQMDVFDAIHLHGPWDMIVAFPPCTHLAVSGAHLFKSKKTDGRQQAAIGFFMALVNAPIPRIAVENPVGIMSTIYRKPDQYIQPYNFGEDASKKTCLWLKNLPVLKPTKHIRGLMARWNGKDVLRWSNQTDSGQNKLSPSKTRAQDRGRTYFGIAAAMASQWGTLETQHR